MLIMSVGIYLDTSVISACVDVRDPARRELTADFWSVLPRYESHISPLVVTEINATSDPVLRNRMLALAAPFRVLEWNEEMERLARCYVTAGAFGPALLSDARHVAAASVAGVPILLSWNFRHLVNRSRRIRVNLVNAQEQYEQIEILAPPELI